MAVNCQLRVGTGGKSWWLLTPCLLKPSWLACTDSSESISQLSGMHAQSGGLSTSHTPEGGYQTYSFSRKELRESCLPLWGARILLVETGLQGGIAQYFLSSVLQYIPERQTAPQLPHHGTSWPVLHHAGHTEPCTIAWFSCIHFTPLLCQALARQAACCAVHLLQCHIVLAMNPGGFFSLQKGRARTCSALQKAQETFVFLSSLRGWSIFLCLDELGSGPLQDPGQNGRLLGVPSFHFSDGCTSLFPRREEKSKCGCVSCNTAVIISLWPWSGMHRKGGKYSCRSMKEALLPCRTCAVASAEGVGGEGAAQEHPTGLLSATWRGLMPRVTFVNLCRGQIWAPLAHKGAAQWQGTVPSWVVLKPRRGDFGTGCSCPSKMPVTPCHIGRLSSKISSSFFVTFYP